LRYVYGRVKIDEINHWFVDQKASISKFITQNSRFSVSDYKKHDLIWEKIGKENTCPALNPDELQVKQAKAILQEYSRPTSRWARCGLWQRSWSVEADDVIQTKYDNLTNLLKALNEKINKLIIYLNLEGDLTKSVYFIIKKSQVNLELDYRKEFLAAQSSLRKKV